MALFGAFLPVRKQLTCLVAALGVGLLSSFPAGVLAQTPRQPGLQGASQSPIPSRYVQIDTLVQKAMDQGQWVGVALGVVEKGNADGEEGVGGAAFRGC